MIRIRDLNASEASSPSCSFKRLIAEIAEVSDVV